MIALRPYGVYRKSKGFLKANPPILSSVFKMFWLYRNSRLIEKWCLAESGSGVCWCLVMFAGVRWCMLVSVDPKLYPAAIRSIFLLVYSGVWELGQVSRPYKPHIATPQLASMYQKIFQAFLYQTGELVNYFCPTICQAFFHIIVFVYSARCLFTSYIQMYSVFLCYIVSKVRATWALCRWIIWVDG